MNSYHPYGDISSPHPPSPDNNNYASSMSIGNAGGHHHNGHAQLMSSIGGQQQGFHQINNNNAMMNKCAGCGSKIAERYLLSAIDKFWHHTCLKCTCCGATLADLGTVCYTRGNMILCKADYSRLFAPPPCSACNQTISPNEFVMRTTSQSSNQQSPNQPNPMQQHVFHIKCFTCSSCTAQLRQGDRYYMLNGKLVCEQDWHKMVKAPVANNSTPPVRKGKVGRPRRSRD
ncbi:LIM domain transcription factor LMO4 [Contarinia nasturtii]|uniref:LIM domain transcription factor LMO4 n=1 Tax=Contarinia nasturtii TaxID=265458 RepID=UPI0012D41D86|nr:LIM domain transcription factor LMO4 [Contarinia nasturtii]XP_031618799.1 LIM domain transcription factor LMO4 [Contarinia nasturtii]XP_031618800.1 LIM domain transcription factor LMO4 [Contarinia nasturtii]XP_031618801.1 LIM domain transcription factor LMO4 [Contarinia nasturtii]XP_031618802.1 LIM domain transcription factor LMO4 [Contarinia nasturtii]XP_031618803.1 LIM domain transcription factor LMO4 [Contarinia nasturtii]